MKFKLLVVLTVLIPLFGWAQKKQNPQMLVYGSDITAFTAAIQSAKSNVPTVWVLEGDEFLTEITTKTLQIPNNHQMDGGVWMNLLMRMAMSKSSSDSLATIVKQDFNPRLALNAVEQMMRDNPNLSLIKGQKITSAQRKKKKWEVTLSNKQKIDVISLVDASAQGDLSSQHKTVKEDTSANSFLTPQQTSLALSRTTLGAAELNKEVYVVSLRNILADENNNLFDAGLVRNLPASVESLGFRAAFGQIIGATAAYCAFFKSNTATIDIRKLQAELLAFGMRMNPYRNIGVNDPHFASIQKFYLTGVFSFDDSHACQFIKETPVRFHELQTVLNDIYTRSQLWFLDNSRDDVLLWKDLLSLIRYISLKGTEVDKQVEKEWRNRLKFVGTFDPEKPVSRAEFAVMLDTYTSAFAKTIGVSGQFVK